MGSCHIRSSSRREAGTRPRAVERSAAGEGGPPLPAANVWHDGSSVSQTTGPSGNLPGCVEDLGGCRQLAPQSGSVKPGMQMRAHPGIPAVHLPGGRDQSLEEGGRGNPTSICGKSGLSPCRMPALPPTQWDHLPRVSLFITLTPSACQHLAPRRGGVERFADV